MARPEQLLVWSAGVGLIDAGSLEFGSADAPLLVADSWLVRDGRVRALDLHRRRFASGCAETAGIDEASVAAFWAAAVEHLPTDGDWFPRVELSIAPRPRLALRIRPSPQRAETVRVWVPDTPDPRRTPQRKGPDLGVLGDLRQAAIEAGANDALLRTSEGFLVEGATSSLLWWEDGTLCMPPPSMPTLPGITTQLIQRRATECGIDVRQFRCRLDALAGREVWWVNALHGIRCVTGWVGADVQAGADRRSAPWREWLDGMSEPVADTEGDQHTVTR